MGCRGVVGKLSRRLTFLIRPLLSHVETRSFLPSVLVRNKRVQCLWIAPSTGVTCSLTLSLGLVFLSDEFVLSLYRCIDGEMGD